MRRSADSFCALACATRACACASPATAVWCAAFCMSYSDFAINASLYKPWARVQSRSERSAIRFRPVEISHRGIQPRLRCHGIRPRSLERRLRRVHVRFRLHILQLRQHLSPLYPIAFFDVQLGNLAESVGPDIHIGLRPDFTGRAHHRNQIHALRLAGLHRDHILVALINSKYRRRRRVLPPLRLQSRFFSRSS